MARALLVVIGCYLASVGLSLVYLVGVLAVTGKSISAGERGVLLFGALTALTYLASIGVVFAAIGKALSTGARVGVSLGYALLLAATFVVLAAVSLLAFNR